jgi:biotin transport system substrate-specific component
MLAKLGANLEGIPILSTAVILDRYVPRTITSDIALVGSGALLIAIAAQIQVPMIPVPMTMQTFAVLLVAAALGFSRGAASAALYLVLGAVGLPVFAGAAALKAAMPTIGYLVGFVAAAALIGYLSERGYAKNPLRLAFAFVAGSAVVYAAGVIGLMAILGIDMQTAIQIGVVPFLIGDALKAALAAALLPVAWKFTK